MSALEAIRAAQAEARVRSERLEELEPDYRVVFLSLPTVAAFRTLIEETLEHREHIPGWEIPPELTLLYEDLGSSELYGPVSDS